MRAKTFKAPTVYPRHRQLVVSERDTEVAVKLTKRYARRICIHCRSAQRRTGATHTLKDGRLVSCAAKLLWTELRIARGVLNQNQAKEGTCIA